MGATSEERTHQMKIRIVKIKIRKRQQTDYGILQNSNQLFRSLAYNNMPELGEDFDEEIEMMSQVIKST